MNTWTFNPNAPGKKIPARLKEIITTRICLHAKTCNIDPSARLDIRFRGEFCYIDAYQEPAEPNPALLKDTGETAAEFHRRMASIPTHLCRLRYYGDLESWGLAFYTYSHERYELCTFPSGSFRGTPEEGFERSVPSICGTDVPEFATLSVFVQDQNLSIVRVPAG